jgi:uncharacterized membrane protein YGL010W
MRTRDELMHEYAKSHQNPTNSLIHVLCVPVIVFSTLGLAWLVPIGRWLGLSADLAPYVNLATLAALPLGLFYLRLSFGSLLTMAVWFVLSGAGIVAIETAQLSLFWISAALWILSWAVQIYGHKVEGAKPSFADDLVFFLVGPLFVTDKLYRRA